MSTRKTVSSKKKGKKKASQNKSSSQTNTNANPPIDHTYFLSTFKTEPCPHEDLPSHVHDRRTCFFYHADKKDKRRNPYENEYDVEEVHNNYERMYHPSIFRTSMCRNPQCPFVNFGVCSKAHDPYELKSREDRMIDYRMSFQRKLKKTSVSDFIPPSSTSSASLEPQQNMLTNERKAPWMDIASFHMKSSSISRMVTFERDSLAWFMIRSSENFRNHLKMIAFEELCVIEIQTNSWSQNHNPLMIMKGLESNVKSTYRAIQDAIRNPPLKFFIRKDKEFISDRVKNNLNAELHALKQKQVRYEFYVRFDEDRISTCIVNNSRSTKVYEDIVNQSFKNIDFWVKQEGYDRFHECCSCLENKNKDEGVECASCGNFICSTTNDGGTSCLKVFVESVIPEIQGQKGNILCMMCQCPIDYQNFATHLDNDTWNKLHQAIVANEVKSEYEKMQSEFDRRLEEKMQELLENYSSSVDKVLKEKAKMNAKKARDDALNLKCPHCLTAYVDFEGCMALQCSTCKRFFCGYCHSKMSSSSGAHDHVRQCLMNETRNGSYFANEEEVKIAHRRYRTRQIKKFLTQFKKQEQNATIIELETDLKQLGIDPTSLIEVGNDLHDIL